MSEDSPQPSPRRHAATWAEIDRLVQDQRFEAAAEKVDALLAEVGGTDDVDTWTRALVRAAQLRLALHGHETAVRALRAAPWPDSPRHRLILEIFLAHSLVSYLETYGYEIGGRERVATREELDLDSWTREQIVAEAHRSYLAVWRERQAWGGESLGELAEYLEQNTYPARIRGTLRDAVTYLWVELLVNTSHWTPRQSNEIYRIDLAQLLSKYIGETEKWTEEERLALLADVDVHPLRKIALVLDDLEAWHDEARRPEAAFEARLERLSRLSGAFERQADRALLLADLETHLDALGRNFSWWSMGQALRAEFYQGSSAADSLVLAHAAAVAGQEAHPKSLGGQQCAFLRARIEQPTYQMLAMSSDGLGKRSIQVTHKNVDKLYFRAFPVDILERLTQSDYTLFPEFQDIPKMLESGAQIAAWSVDLPTTEDFREHQTWVTPPFEKPGVYTVIASARSDFSRLDNRMLAIHLGISDMVLLSRRDKQGTEVTVRSGETGEPVAGAEVRIYRYVFRQGHQLVDGGVSGEDGRLRLRFVSGPRSPAILVARRGDEITIDAAPHAAHQSLELTREERSAILVYTDRSAYRPLQTLHWKAVAYRGLGAEYRVLPGEALTAELQDANGQLIETATAVTNDFGTASGRFELPAGRLLGSWQIRVTAGGGRGSAVVQVEEYKRPTFEVKVDDPPEALRLNRPATLVGEARYYFGLPLSDAEVDWRVTRERLYPIFGWGWGRIAPPSPGGEEILVAGEARVGEDGRFEITFTPSADERLADDQGTSYRYRLSVDVTDPGGETRSAARSFRVGFTAVEARVDDARGFLAAGAPNTLHLRRADLDGTPRAGKASWRLIALEQPASTPLPAEIPVEIPLGTEEEFRTPGDLLRPRWETNLEPRRVLAQWKDGETVARGELNHGADGEALLELPETPPGVYRLRYATDDAYGRTFEFAHELFVVAEGEETGTRNGKTTLHLPAVLAAERSTVGVGETLRLLVHSGLENQDMLLEFYRDGERIERRPLRSAPGVRVVEIPIGEAHRGGFGARLVLLRDHQAISLEERIAVPWDDRALDIELLTFRDRLRPGDRETWRLTVRGTDQKELAAGAAEILAYMYDKSLDLFAAHHPPRPFEIYPDTSRLPGLRVNLDVARTAWAQVRGYGVLPRYETPRPDRLKIFDDYPIGGPGRRGGMEMMKMSAVSADGAPMQRMAIPSPPAPTPSSPSPPAMAQSAEIMDAAPQAEMAADGASPGDTGGDGLRTDFAESAFWQPHLLLAEGGVAFEFTVPDAVTEWSFWAHALTRDLRSGVLEKSVRTVKELLVRPQIPRFLREGDQATIEVLVSNTGEAEMVGEVRFEILDPETDADLSADFGLAAAASTLPFTAAPGGSTALAFEIAAPHRVGPVAFRVVGRSGALGDGELRPLPILPGRLHLSQSRFAALRGEDRRVLRFDDMAAQDDPSLEHEQLVVTLDGQLLGGVLGALPYLARYPYQCTEQTLNRFLSTGIVAGLAEKYPALAVRMERLAERDTPLETWDAVDPNRKMALEETPWLVAAQGGAKVDDDTEWLRILDPRVASAERAAALLELEKAQTPEGGFPWWPGGPPSSYITLYLLQGFARAIEHDVQVPQLMVQRAWQWVHGELYAQRLDEWMEKDCCWEQIAFLSYVLSSFPPSESSDDPGWTGATFSRAERDRMLDFAARHWRGSSPRIKAYLALALHRAGRGDQAREIWESVMDSAKTDDDLGTFWAPEDRAWLWYNDTLEGHALALRVLLEIAPDDARRHGLVQWLFLNKKLNHWKSTRATAEVLYALVHYLEAEGALAVREEATVTAGSRRETFVFSPDGEASGETGTGGGVRHRMVIPGAEIEPGSMSKLVIEKATPGLLFASATWHFATDALPAEARGDFFKVERTFYRRVVRGEEAVLEPLAEGVRLAPGDEIEVRLALHASHAAEYVHLRDPRGAGFEPSSNRSGYRWDLGISWYEEIRDSGANFFFEWLPAGEYVFRHRLRATHAGTFRVGPAQVQSMYAPDFVAYSSGARLEVGAED